MAAFDKVWALRQQGWSGKSIAHHLGIGKSTVFNYLRSPTFPERKGRSDRGKRSLLKGYKAHLLTRWNEGCHEALRPFHKIQHQGYRGSYPTVARYIQRLRHVANDLTRRGNIVPGLTVASIIATLPK